MFFKNRTTIVATFLLLLNAQGKACLDHKNVTVGRKQTSTPVIDVSSGQIPKDSPWFLGKKAITYCIDHGGPQQFSLPLEKAKKIIKSVVPNFFRGVQKRNLNGTDSFRIAGLEWLSDENQSYFSPVWEYEEDHYTSGKLLFLSDQAEYISNCDEADLEIILGNVKNPKVQKVISQTSEADFKRFAGLAVLTEYDRANYRGKGFIYLAADKGKLQYSGIRGGQANLIWSNHAILDDQMTQDNLPPAFNFFVDTNVKRNYESVLRSVLLHELGHVLGIKHTPQINIMNEDFPAFEVQKGLTLEKRINDEARFFQYLSGGQLEDVTFNTFVFDASGQPKSGNLFRFNIDPIEGFDKNLYKLVFEVYNRNLDLLGHEEREVYLNRCTSNLSGIPGIELSHLSTYVAQERFYDLNLQQWVTGEEFRVLEPSTAPMVEFSADSLCGILDTPLTGFPSIEILPNFSNPNGSFYQVRLYNEFRNDTENDLYFRSFDFKTKI